MPAKCLCDLFRFQIDYVHLLRHSELSTGEREVLTVARHDERADPAPAIRFGDLPQFLAGLRTPRANVTLPAGGDEALAIVGELRVRQPAGLEEIELVLELGVGLVLGRDVS